MNRRSLNVRWRASSLVSAQKSLFTLIVELLLILAIAGAGWVAAQTGGGDDVYLPITVSDGSSGSIFYLSPDGNDSADGRSAATAWATFDRAWDDIYPGDTLILLDGVYRQSLWPNERDGEPGNPIIVRAQNDGKAIIDGEGVRVPIQLGQAWPGRVGNWYVIEGVVARNGDRVPDDNERLEGSGSVIFLPGHNNVLRRVSAYDASPDDNSIIITFDARGSHNTVEDCVAAGTGRKAIMIYGSDYNVVRRCVAMWTRFDGRNTRTWPWGENIDIYNADNNLIENSISLGHVPKYGITIRANADHVSASHNRILGSMALYSGKDLDGNYLKWECPPPGNDPDDICLDIEGNPGYRVGLKFFGTGLIQNNIIRDVLMMGNASYGLSVNGNPTNTTMDHITIRDNDIPSGSDLIENMSTGSNTISNSFIEGTSHLGEGARLEHRYVDGVLTNEPLWPWPMEQRIQDELAFSLTDFVSSIDPAIRAPSPSKPINIPTNTPTPLKPVADVATIPTVHIPRVSPGDPYEAAITWFGRVDPNNNYADLRFLHDDESLKVVAHVIDRRLWYDESADVTSLTDWDAVSLFLDTGGERYRFDAQVKHWQDDEDYRAAFVQSNGAWELSSIAFATDTFARDASFNNNTDNRGWSVKFTIPFSSLAGVSSPPARGDTWRVAAVVHDRDGATTPIATSTWPSAMSETNANTWGWLVFDQARHNFTPTINRSITTVRHGLDGRSVEDAHVGGHSNCGEDFNSNFFDGWGDANYAGYAQINIQNQWDIADWPCFSKFYVTFPLPAAPPGKVLVSATLTLHQFGNAWGESGVEPSWIQVSTVAEDWNEGTLTWNNAPLPMENVSGTWVEPMSESLEWPGVAWDWDVSRAVAQAYQTSQPLRLVMYSPDGHYHSGKYFSSSDVDDENADARPTLVMRWGQPIDMGEWLNSFVPIMIVN